MAFRALELELGERDPDLAINGDKAAAIYQLDTACGTTRSEVGVLMRQMGTIIPTMHSEAFRPNGVSDGRTVLVTGGCGFIGSSFLNSAVPRLGNTRFVNLDCMSYAANPQNLEAIRHLPNYELVHGSFADEQCLESLFAAKNPDWVIHFGAETHVDRSIKYPRDFLVANVVGTFNLLEACRTHWTDFRGKLFHHVSTDEVYGSLGVEGAFSEATAYDPSSPYSASKAASDHFVRAYHRTYGLPIRITNCSNNYGPRQFPEKLIPLMILNALAGKPLPVYGKGDNVRDWLHVDDHCSAIWDVATRGRDGETYNIGGHGERTNLEVVKQICVAVAHETGKPIHEVESLIQFVTDRPGHDHRYAIDPTKVEQELGWKPQHTFESGLQQTVRWYLENPAWVEAVRTGTYRQWIEEQYAAGGPL